MNLTCKIVNMIYNFLYLNKIRKINEASNIIYSKAMPHPSRTLKDHDIVYVIKGNFHICQANEEIIAEEGDVFFLTGNKYHFSNVNSPKDTECIFFHFDTDEKDYASNELPTENSENYICIPMKLSASNNPKIKQLFSEILNLFWKNSNLSKKIYASHLLQLFIELEAVLFKSNFANNLGDEIAFKIIDLLNHNKNKNLTVQDLSHALSFSPRTLHLHFKKSMGITIHQYQLNLKLSSAAIMLRDYPLMTLKEIADNYGFFDEFHFSKSFKSKFKISPQEYRLKNNKAPL